MLRRKVPLVTRDTWYLHHGDAVEAVFGILFGAGLAISAYLAWKNRSVPSRGAVSEPSRSQAKPA